MPTAETLHTYEEIAEQFHQLGEAEQRDIFLVLAADTAFNTGLPELAEQIRLRLLTLNPYHLLRPYLTFTEALQSADIQSYIEDLVRRYPPETAPRLLADLKDRQYAAAARDLLFAESEAEVADLRVFQQIEESTPAAAPVTKPAPRTAEAPRRGSSPSPGLPVNLAAPAPWLRQDQGLYDSAGSTADRGGDTAEILGNWMAIGLFLLAAFAAAALFGWTIVFPLLD